MIVGPPCQPFSRYSGVRFHFTEHELVESVYGHELGFGPRKQKRYDSLRDLVHRTLPFAVLIEEIEEFLEVDAELGKSPSRVLLEDLTGIKNPENPEAQYYVGCRVWRREANKMPAVSRNRIA